MTIESQVTNTLKQAEFWTVSQLNQAVSQVLEDQLDVCWVRGEIRFYNIQTFWKLYQCVFWALVFHAKG